MTKHNETAKSEISQALPGYKVLTHDYRPPIQGGEPLLTANTPLPFTLPKIKLDESDNECGHSGWHYCEKPETALRNRWALAGRQTFGAAACRGQGRHRTRQQAAGWYARDSRAHRGCTVSSTHTL